MGVFFVVDKAKTSNLNRIALECLGLGQGDMADEFGDAKIAVDHFLGQGMIMLHIATNEAEHIIIRPGNPVGGNDFGDGFGRVGKAFVIGGGLAGQGDFGKDPDMRADFFDIKYRAIAFDHRFLFKLFDPVKAWARA